MSERRHDGMAPLAAGALLHLVLTVVVIAGQVPNVGDILRANN